MCINAAALESNRNATNQISLEFCASDRFLCTAAYILQPTALVTTRANIQCGAGKNRSGGRTMDLFVVVIIAAMLFTVATVFLGVLTMSGGGTTDKTLSTPLMWARVGFQALTLLLLFAAIRLR
jgi:Hypoxia induced protein conserved region